MSDLFSIRGKTALVTGGSRGIGEMIVRGYVDAGAKVYLSSRKADVCEALAEDLRDAGGDATALPADLSTEHGCAELAGELESREGSLDILVNNAGATWGAPLEEFDEAAWDRVLVPQREGRLLHDEVPAAAAAGRRHRGRSRAGHQHRLDRRDPHAVARDLLVLGVEGRGAQLTRHLAKQLAPTCHGQRDRPGSVPVEDDALDARGLRRPDRRVGADEADRPAPDMAGAAIYLASPAASYVTGAVLPVDGGIATLLVSVTGRAGRGQAGRPASGGCERDVTGS